MGVKSGNRHLERSLGTQGDPGCICAISCQVPKLWNSQIFAPTPNSCPKRQSCGVLGVHRFASTIPAHQNDIFVLASTGPAGELTKGDAWKVASKATVQQLPCNAQINLSVYLIILDDILEGNCAVQSDVDMHLVIIVYNIV